MFPFLLPLIIGGVERAKSDVQSGVSRRLIRVEVVMIFRPSSQLQAIPFSSFLLDSIGSHCCRMDAGGIVNATVRGWDFFNECLLG